jgi:hypothetical protein
MKPIWTKIVPFFDYFVDLKDVFITFKTTEYPYKMENSKRIERVYSRKNFNLLSERILYTERKYRPRGKRYSSYLEIRDISTDDRYYLHNGVLYW